MGECCLVLRLGDQRANGRLQRLRFQTCTNLSHGSCLKPMLWRIAEIVAGRGLLGSPLASATYAASRSTSGSSRALANAALASAIPLLPRSRVSKFNFWLFRLDFLGVMSIRRNCPVMSLFLPWGGTVRRKLLTEVLAQ